MCGPRTPYDRLSGECLAVTYCCVSSHAKCHDGSRAHPYHNATPITPAQTHQILFDTNFNVTRVTTFFELIQAGGYVDAQTSMLEIDIPVLVYE